MKRLLVLAAALLVAIGALLAALPLLVSSENVRSRILSHVSDLTGREVAFSGNPNVSFSPFLGIEVQDLVIADPYSDEGDTPFLHAEFMQAQLDVLPALFGSIKISEYRLLRPKLNLKTYANGMENWRFQTGGIKRAIDAGSGNTAIREAASFGKFKIVDGILEYEDEISGNSDMLSGMDGVIDWPGTSRPASVEGSAIWRGERVSLTAELENALALFSSGESEVSVRFTSTPLNLVFSGSANMLPDLFLNGELTASTPSLNRLSNLARLELAEFSNFGSVDLRGLLSGTTGDYRLSDAEVSLAGQEANGVLRLSTDEVGVPRIDGTLAFDGFDLTSYFAIPDQNGKPGGASQVSRRIRADLRVSANTMLFHGINLERVAASIYAGGGEWVFDIGDSQAFGGQFIGKVGERFENDSQQLFLQLSGRGVDAGSISTLLAEAPVSISGTADIDLDLRLNEMSADKPFGRMDGVVSLLMEKGNLNGIDFIRLLDKSTAGVSPEVLDFSSGGTPFEELSYKMFLNGGLASISKASFRSGDALIQVFGNADFKTGTLALRAQEVTEAGPEPERLFIGGTFSSPLVALKPGEPKPAPENQEEPAGQVSN